MSNLESHLTPEDVRKLSIFRELKDGDDDPRRFLLVRHQDVSGVSGTGVVAEGVVFSDGSAAMRWRSAHTSTAIYGSVDDLVTIHGHGGNTEIHFID